MDRDPSELSRECNFQSTLDGKKIKFKVMAVPQDGEGPIRKFGDGSDGDVLDGTLFPAIPPAKLPSRLPQLVASTQVNGFDNCPHLIDHCISFIAVKLTNFVCRL